MEKEYKHTLDVKKNAMGWDRLGTPTAPTPSRNICTRRVVSSYYMYLKQKICQAHCVFFLQIVHKNEVKSDWTKSTKFKGLEVQAKVHCSKSL